MIIDLLINFFSSQFLVPLRHLTAILPLSIECHMRSAPFDLLFLLVFGDGYSAKSMGSDNFLHLPETYCIISVKSIV